MQLQRIVPTFPSFLFLYLLIFFFPVAIGPKRFALLFKVGSICLTEEKHS